MGRLLGATICRLVSQEEKEEEEEEQSKRERGRDREVMQDNKKEEK